MDTNAHGLCKCNDYLYSAQIKIWDCSWPHSQVSWPEFSYQEITFRLCETYWLIFPSQKICVILSRISKNLLHLMNIGWVSPLSPCLFSLSRLSLPPFSFFFYEKDILLQLPVMRWQCTIQRFLYLLYYVAHSGIAVYISRY